MSDQAVNSALSQLSEDQVVDYLQRNKDFFVKHEYLLRDLTVPHQSGSAISLGERQVQLFREHRDGLREQLNDLIAVARENDRHFEKSKRLLLNLLEVKTLDEVEIVVQEVFRNDEKIDFGSVVVFGDSTDYPISDITLVPFDEARSQLGTLIDSSSAVCGHFSTQQRKCLFGSDGEKVASAAIIPLRNAEVLGMFCLGSTDPKHFDSSMGSLFLSYISDFISRILPDLLLKSRSIKTQESVPTLLE
ncbi:MAG: DUF484 domain-containing protein [Oleiphilus sp.]|nr:MAG: DUF484 domain-containing protein [Oleiphilus sp.]